MILDAFPKTVGGLFWMPPDRVPESAAADVTVVFVGPTVRTAAAGRLVPINRPPIPVKFSAILPASVHTKHHTHRYL